MRLREILSGCEYEMVTSNPPYPPLSKGGQRGGVDTEISGIAYDSRKVVEDFLFVAIRGESLDGHDFISDAIKRGAAAIVHEKAGQQIPPHPPLTKRGQRGGNISSPIFIKVEDSRRALACISNNFYERPSEDISVIGITGTNGKTTTSYLIKSILEAWKKDVGLIGTITYSIGEKHYPALYTTPESLEFQGLLFEMASAGCSHVVTEVSSHSLSQRRVDCTRFVVVVFTNLTRDHLDFHGTMENYYAAKERLFTELLSDEGAAIINVDDEWGRRLITTLKEKSEAPSIMTYGIEREADIVGRDIDGSLSGITFTLTYRDKSCRIFSPLFGIPNVYNVLAAASAGVALNIPMAVIQEGVRNITSIKGRLEKIDAGQDFLCIVDYAHTPDALERLLSTTKAFLKKRGSPGRIITLFGCGGNRDRGKRPLMGEIATRLSDYAIITSDNPRSEDPVEIIKEIVSGVHRDNYRVVPDRRDAIAMAVEKAGAGDIILIAGKGHEDYQEIRGVRHRFSDREIAEEAIKKKLKRMHAAGYKMQDRG